MSTSYASMQIASKKVQSKKNMQEVERCSARCRIGRVLLDYCTLHGPGLSTGRPAYCKRSYNWHFCQSLQGLLTDQDRGRAGFASVGQPRLPKWAILSELLASSADTA